MYLLPIILATDQGRNNPWGDENRPTNFRKRRERKAGDFFIWTMDQEEQMCRSIGTHEKELENY